MNEALNESHLTAVAKIQPLTMNNRVAVEPFPLVGLKKTATGTGSIKVGGVENNATLTKLKVIFDARIVQGNYVQVISAGRHVYVKTEVAAIAHAAYEVDGKKFILLPIERVELVTE